jgi:transcription elongation factor greA
MHIVATLNTVRADTHVSALNRLTHVNGGTMADTQWLTQAQYDLLAYELKERIEVKRVEIARLIDAARQEGDLRENGGYHAARNEQSMNETRIQVLQEMLEHAEVGDTPADDGIVEPGMVVTAIVAGREQTFLLGSRDAGGDLGIQVFSAQAPLGAAVIGHKAGDKLSFEAPTGRMIDVEIIEAKPFEG